MEFIPLGIVGGLIVLFIVLFVVDSAKNKKYRAEKEANQSSTCEKIWEERRKDIQEALLQHGLSPKFVEMCDSPTSYIEPYANIVHKDIY